MNRTAQAQPFRIALALQALLLAGPGLAGAQAPLEGSAITPDQAGLPLVSVAFSGAREWRVYLDSVRGVYWCVGPGSQVQVTSALPALPGPGWQGAD